MSKEGDDFEAKMMALQEKKSLILAHIKILIRDYEHLEAEEEKLSDVEFIRTGSTTFKMSIDINITEDDILRDLIKRTEGKNIKPDQPNQN